MYKFLISLTQIGNHLFNPVINMNKSIEIKIDYRDFYKLLLLIETSNCRILWVEFFLREGNNLTPYSDLIFDNSWYDQKLWAIEHIEKVKNIVNTMITEHSSIDFNKTELSVLIVLQ